jgi:MFS family permease
LLLLAPVVGGLLDRMNARRLALAALGIAVAAETAMALLAAAHALTLPALFALVVVVSVTAPATLTFRRMIVGQIASTEDLAPAYGLFSLGTEASLLLGPAAGGLIIGRFSLAAALAILALGTAVYLVTVAMTPYVREERCAVPSFDVLRGARELVKRPIVLGVTLLTFSSFSRTDRSRSRYRSPRAPSFTRTRRDTARCGRRMPWAPSPVC